MATAKKEVIYRMFDEKNFVSSMHPKTRRFITANENNEFVVSGDDREAIEILKRAVDTSEVQVIVPCG